jgi:hypothetical protein
MIHGQRDTYISPEVVEELFERGNGPKELWLVPDAKHNRCREREPEAYAGRLLDFIDRYAPRRPITESTEPQPEPAAGRAIVADAEVAGLAGEYTGPIEAPEVPAGEVAAPLR